MHESLEWFIREVASIIREGGTEQEVTARVADRMKEIICIRNLLDPMHMKTKAGGYVLHPIHIAEDGSFSITGSVWNVGQTTPIHDHGTWGVIGIYSGVEHEERFPLPGRDGASAGPRPMQCIRVKDSHPGEVFVCCTSDQDIHRVSCGSDVPCVGLHVYGGDIGRMKRRAYDPETGRARVFVSGWD